MKNLFLIAALGLAACAGPLAQRAAPGSAADRCQAKVGVVERGQCLRYWRVRNGEYGAEKRGLQPRIASHGSFDAPGEGVDAPARATGAPPAPASLPGGGHTITSPGPLGNPLNDGISCPTC